MVLLVCDVDWLVYGIETRWFQNDLLISICQSVIPCTWPVFALFLHLVSVTFSLSSFCSLVILHVTPLAPPLPHFHSCMIEVYCVVKHQLTKWCMNHLTGWLLYAYKIANSAFHPSRIGKWVPASAGKAKAGMVHSVSGCTRGVQVKLWDPLRTCAIPTWAP